MNRRISARARSSRLFVAAVLAGILAPWSIGSEALPASAAPGDLTHVSLIGDSTMAMGGTMRCGAYDAVLAKGSKVAEIYGTQAISERHRHRYEVNIAYKDAIEKAFEAWRNGTGSRRIWQATAGSRSTKPASSGATPNWTNDADRAGSPA